MASAHPAYARDTQFEMSKPVQQAFGAMIGNPVTILGTALLFGVLPQQLFSFVIQPAIMPPDSPGGFPTLAGIAISLLSFLLSMTLSAFSQGALAPAALAHHEGRHASFGACVGTALLMAIPLFGMAIISALGLLAGFVLLLIPGIILYLMWSVAAPVLVIERTGIIGALRRSRYLTLGARMKIFALACAIALGAWGISLLFGLFSFPEMTAVEIAEQIGVGHIPIGYLLYSTASGTLVTAFWGLFVTFLYINLRDLRDGPQGETLAEVFA